VAGCGVIVAAGQVDSGLGIPQDGLATWTPVSLGRGVDLVQCGEVRADNHDMSNSVRNVLAGLGVFFVCIATLPAVFASSAESGSERLGYLIGVLLVVVGVPVLFRYIYVRLRGGERPLWSRWLVVIALALAVAARAGAAGQSESMSAFQKAAAQICADDLPRLSAAPDPATGIAALREMRLHLEGLTPPTDPRQNSAFLSWQQSLIGLETAAGQGNGTLIQAFSTTAAADVARLGLTESCPMQTA
jgi:hypothetical protein